MISGCCLNKVSEVLQILTPPKPYLSAIPISLTNCTNVSFLITEFPLRQMALLKIFLSFQIQYYKN